MEISRRTEILRFLSDNENSARVATISHTYRPCRKRSYFGKSCPFRFQLCIIPQLQVAGMLKF